MDPLLLGGWRHVAEDVRKLATGLKALPDACACGHGSAHLAGTCPCCRNGERTLDSGCTNCEALIASLRDAIDELVDASLRFLPFVESMSSPEDVVDVRGLRRQVARISTVFLQLETAADEFRQGCSASHVSVLKTLANELAERTHELDATLSPTGAGRVRIRLR